MYFDEEARLKAAAQVTSDGSKVTQWEPDMYKTGTKTWKNYDDACIHIKCGRVTYNSWDKFWTCVDDMPGAAALNLNDLAILAREAGHLKTSNYDGDLFDSKKGGNFYKEGDVVRLETTRDGGRWRLT